jgi:N-acetylmuramoyl-L-alanine amidase
LKKDRRVRFYLGLFAAGILAIRAQAAPFDWRIVKFGGKEYVSLDVFCESYGLTAVNGWSEDKLRLQGANGRSLLLTRGSHEAKINGVRHWLSANALGEGDNWYLSRLDLVKMIEPIYRPEQIRNRQPVRGVVIDPGHGGNDQGAMGRGGAMEKAFTLDTAIQLERILKASGLKTVLTRRTDFFVDLYERTAIAARYSGYIFVSIHYNSGPRSARGTETFSLAPRGSPSTTSENRLTRADFEAMRGNGTDELNTLLASLVHRQLIKLRGPDDEADRGMKRARFVVLRENVLPSILVEGGFVSHPSEVRLLLSPDYRKKLAKAVSEGIFDYMKAMGQSVAASAPLTTPTPTAKPATVNTGVKSGKTATPSPTPTKPKVGPSPTPTSPAVGNATQTTPTPLGAEPTSGTTTTPLTPATETSPPTPTPVSKPKVKLKTSPKPKKAPSLTPTPTRSAVPDSPSPSVSPTEKTSITLQPGDLTPVVVPAVREIPTQSPTITLQPEDTPSPTITPEPTATPMPSPTP